MAKIGVSRTANQIGAIGWHRNIRVKKYALLPGALDREQIIKRDALHHGDEIVISVFALTRDLQIQVDLGICLYLDDHTVLLAFFNTKSIIPQETALCNTFGRISVVRKMRFALDE
jgi:hypothetical protein